MLSSAAGCWPRDRHADDNNGNCASPPYDKNCGVDKEDAGDNIDLCYNELFMDRFDSNTEADGFRVYEDDEGLIHCHGFAWSNDEAIGSFFSLQGQRVVLCQ